MIILKKMKFEAGIFGCKQNEKKEISLAIGWLVSPSDSPDKGKEDMQFGKGEEILSDNNSDDSDNSERD